jgi:predicted esterase YcpF (UPF0227 family)
MESYSKMPRWKKAAISALIATGVGLTTGAAVGAGAAIFFGSKKFARAYLGGAAAGLAFSGVYNRRMERAERYREEETAKLENKGVTENNLREWRIYIDEQTAEYQKIIQEVTKRRRNSKKWATGAAIGVGGLFAATELAMNNISTNNVSINPDGTPKTPLNETPPSPKDTPPTETPKDTPPSPKDTPPTETPKNTPPSPKDTPPTEPPEETPITMTPELSSTEDIQSVLGKRLGIFSNDNFISESNLKSLTVEDVMSKNFPGNYQDLGEQGRTIYDNKVALQGEIAALVDNKGISPNTSLYELLSNKENLKLLESRHFKPTF